MAGVLAAATAVAVLIAAVVGPASAGDPFAFYDWNIEYKTVAPLGVEQKVLHFWGKKIFSFYWIF